MHDKEGKTGRSEACGSGSGDPEAARSGYLTVQLPDGRYGYAAAAAMGELPDAGAMTEEEIRGGIVLHALSYLGTQYRWGGKSPAGIDCSGLAFMSCLLTGIPIYRDAAMPEGFPVHAIPKEKLRRGDLIYFPGHVAVSLGGERFVHATGHRGESGVVRGSFSPEDEGYRADLSGHVTGYGSLFPAAEMPGLPAVLSLYEGE